MLKTEIEQTAFCKEYNISESKFRKSRLTWEELEEIAEDFNPKRNEHQNTLKSYADALRLCNGVHSLSYRVKDTGHLIEKIIRKNPEYLERGDSISKLNYDKELTDLMGIRILLLFKEDWIPVHEYIMQNYGKYLAEHPFAYVREGDNTSLYEGKVNIRKEKPYRSVHYVVRTELGLGIEIQVRTLYEEAWSEIDHKLRYPYNMTNVMLTEYVNIMNRLTGIGDEMGTFIHSYIKAFQEEQRLGIVGENEIFQSILQELEKCDNAELKQSITDKIMQAEKYRKMKKMADLLNKLSLH